MTWEYRVLKRNGQFTVHEVYYDDDDGRVNGYTDLPAYPHGDTLEGLIEDMRRYGKAIELPVLDYQEDNDSDSQDS